MKTMDPRQKVTFYTALYHTCLSPILYEDVDGTYLGLDQNIHSSEDLNYTIFFLFGIPTVLCIPCSILYSLSETTT